MVEEIRNGPRYPISDEMKSEMSRLDKIPVNDLSMDDYVSLEDIVNYVRYGPPIPVEEPILKSVDGVPVESFADIIQENDARKIYPSMLKF